MSALSYQTVDRPRVPSLPEAAFARRDEPGASRALVVVVDDDPAVRSALKFSLEVEGYQVEVCDSGEALLACQLPDSRACLVLDYGLPGMSGLDVVSLLRRREVHLPAVLITSHPPRALRTAAAAAGVWIVEKPLLGDSLLDAIRTTLAD